ncbi:MAG: class I SAM-dependent methyltransferase [Roseburia sp.]|nr:class I SAM-dependent methyltransferase [Roseburia sp.]MCM1098793.1 class I SAM-dependent methyltransferase [Ruminococcus flavefaciens]
MLAGMVTPGSRAADVGCDHGFLSIWLVQKGICPHVLAMDVHKGPLAAAKEHVADCGLGAYIETRLSDGLKSLTSEEADTVICAGMGGPLMAKILAESMEKAKGMKELILQPQSELREFRAFLRDAGFRILEEDAVFEEGKYYFAMKAVWRGEGAEADAVKGEETQRLCDEYGRLLLERRHPVLRQYLLFRKGIVEELLGRLAARDGGRAAQRLEELQRELGMLEEALRRFRCE